MTIAVKSVSVQLLERQRLAGSSQDERPSLAARLLTLIQRYMLFALLWVLPTGIVGTYFLVVAEDIYVSTVTYTVRTPSGPSPMLALGGASAQLGESSFGRSSEDAYSINAFMASHDAVALLQRELNLRQIYARRGLDAIASFPIMFGDDSNESLVKYYQQMIKVRFDDNTGITTLSVYAFDPADAQRMVIKLMEGGEALANRLTQRMRQDMVERAQAETANSRTLVLEAHENIARWRTREREVDPTRFSVAIIEVIARLSLELAQLRAQLAELQRVSPQNPNVQSIQIRITSLQNQITEEKRGLAGGSASLAPKIVQYELLLLQKTLAEQHYSATIAAQELARAEAQRQRIYVERITQPKLADFPASPYRIIGTLLFAALAYCFFIIMKILLGNIVGHGAFARYFARH